MKAEDFLTFILMKQDEIRMRKEYIYNLNIVEVEERMYDKLICYMWKNDLYEKHFPTPYAFENTYLPTYSFRYEGILFRKADV